MHRVLCTRLQQLKMRDNRTIDDASVIALTQASPELGYLSMIGCSRVSDYGFTAIAENCCRLRTLVLKKRFSYAGGGVRATDDSA